MHRGTGPGSRDATAERVGAGPGRLGFRRPEPFGPCLDHHRRIAYAPRDPTTSHPWSPVSGRAGRLVRHTERRGRPTAGRSPDPRPQRLPRPAPGRHAHREFGRPDRRPDRPARASRRRASRPVASSTWPPTFAPFAPRTKNTVFVSAGDLVGATPLLSALFHDEPTVEAFNLMKLDFNGVGNHEFDEGIDELPSHWPTATTAAAGYRPARSDGCHPVDGCGDSDGYAAPRSRSWPPTSSTGTPARRSSRRTPSSGPGDPGGLHRHDPRGHAGDRDPRGHQVGQVPRRGRDRQRPGPAPSSVGASRRSSSCSTKAARPPSPATAPAATRPSSTAASTRPVPCRRSSTAMDDAIDIVVTGHTNWAVNCVIDGKVVTGCRRPGPPGHRHRRQARPPDRRLHQAHHGQQPDRHAGRAEGGRPDRADRRVRHGRRTDRRRARRSGRRPADAGRPTRTASRSSDASSPMHRSRIHRSPARTSR